MTQRPSIRTQIMLTLFASTLLTLLLVGGIFLFFTAGYARNLGQVYLQESARDIQVLLSSPTAQNIQNPAELSDLLLRVNPVPRIQLRMVDPSRTQILSEIAPTRRTEIQSQLMMRALEGSQGSDQPVRVPFIRPIPIMRGDHQFPPMVSRMGRMIPRDIQSEPRDTRNSIPTNGQGIDFGTMGFVSPSRFEIALSAGNQGLILQLEAPSEGIAQLFRTAVLGMIIASIIALGITGILSLWAARTFTAPLLGFAQALGQISPEDLISQSHGDSPNLDEAPWRNYGTTKEMQTVTKSFDTMSKEIHKWYQKVLEEQETLKSFLADASHELRTPVMAATTFVELAKTSLTKANSPVPQLYERLEDIERQIERMNQVVQRLLRSARSNFKDDQVEPVNLEHLVSQLLRDISAAYPTTNLVLESSFHLTNQSNGKNLVTNREKLTTVLQILLENCFIHGSRPILEKKLQEPEAEAEAEAEERRLLTLDIELKNLEYQPNNAIELRITDQGLGFENPEILGSTEYGTWNAKHTTRYKQGLGIGLSTAKQLVDQLGGRLRFENRLEGGLIAIVVLPMNPMKKNPGDQKTI